MIYTCMEYQADFHGSCVYTKFIIIIIFFSFRLFILIDFGTN